MIYLPVKLDRPRSWRVALLALAPLTVVVPVALQVAADEWYAKMLTAAVTRALGGWVLLAGVAALARRTDTEPLGILGTLAALSAVSVGAFGLYSGMD